MKLRQNSKQILSGLAFGFLVFTGTYNAVVINSESSILSTDTRFAKRLDEVYGALESKREVAAAMNWQKLSVKQAAQVRAANPSFQKEQQQSSTASVEQQAPPAITEALSLVLADVSNPNLWKAPLTNSDFTGSLSTKDGSIESLVADVKGNRVEVSFAELEGNTFTYDLDGMLYTGMLYQDAAKYAVVLTNGPLAGTRMVFENEQSYEDLQQKEESMRLAAETPEMNQEAAPQEVAQSEPVYQDAPTPEQIQNAYNYDQGQQSAM